MSAVPFQGPSPVCRASGAGGPEGAQRGVAYRRFRGIGTKGKGSEAMTEEDIEKAVALYGPLLRALRAIEEDRAAGRFWTPETSELVSQAVEHFETLGFENAYDAVRLISYSWGTESCIIRDERADYYA